MDAITVDHVARLVRELRAEGKSEWTAASVLKAANRVFRFAKRRLDWHGENPVAGLEASERPTIGTERRRIYQGTELAETLAAANEPYRTLFALASVTGARISECLGLVWGDLSLEDRDEAEVSFAAQVDRKGQRQPLKRRNRAVRSSFLDSSRSCSPAITWRAPTSGRMISCSQPAPAGR